MEKLDLILQDMVVGEFGKNTWLLILQRCLAVRDFDQHVESYGAQRVAAQEQNVRGAGCGREISPGSPLRDASAEVLDATAAGLLEGLGGHYARSLQKKCASPRRPLASAVDYFSAIAFYFNSCSWILEAVVPGTLQVTSGGDGWLKIRCGLRENDMGIFLKGFLSEIQGGLDGPTPVTHSKAISPGGDFIHSFVSRNVVAPAREDNAGCMAEAISSFKNTHI